MTTSTPTEIPRPQSQAASFRDPSGFLFHFQGNLFRQVNRVYKDHYDHLMSSGLYQRLVAEGLLVQHTETDTPPAEPQIAYKVIQPEPIGFISYPYEWSFSQLKDAALTTLKIQRIALEYEMSLKDSSAYNIQFHLGKPVLIDTLSFENYQAGKPWIAYRQFCQHFLSPLSLMAKRDVRLNQLLRIYIDGIPLDLASSLLPFRTRFSIPLLLHIHLHASSQKRYGSRPVDTTRQMNKLAFQGLIDNLEICVRRLKWEPKGTEWGDYYEFHNYSQAGQDQKLNLVSEFIAQAHPQTVWDLGANTGLFSRAASNQGIATVAFDIDPAAVEQNYRQCRLDGEENLLPLTMDLTNPSGGIGWSNQERRGLTERGPADLVMALAMLHHLAIANNIPLLRIAAFLRQISRWLIIEFVPKEDPQVGRLLANRQDIFDTYDRQHFEQAFEVGFQILRVEPIPDSGRLLYFMETK